MARLLLAIAAFGISSLAFAQELPPFSAVTDTAPLKQLMTDYSDLKDPFSAEFRRMEVREIVHDGGKTAKVWCGQVNAKNSNGGYAGWSDFVVLESSSKPIIAIDNGLTASVSKIMIDHLCKEAAIAQK